MRLYKFTYFPYIKKFIHKKGYNNNIVSILKYTIPHYIIYCIYNIQFFFYLCKYIFQIIYLLRVHFYIIINILFLSCMQE